MYYLKYRPDTIAQLDNSRVKEILSKILIKNDLPHALLFIGKKGTGKTSSARIFAKAVNCLENKFFGVGKDFEPCNKCKNCKAIAASVSTDVIEMDAASNRGIEEIKDLIKEISFLPMGGRYRVFIIDEAHMITADGFNALLKTLEEPPKTAIFILATTNPEKLPPTIISRCIKINFGKGKREDIILMLRRICKAESLEVETKILELIANHSESSFRDAAKILEEVVTQKMDSYEKVENYLGVRGKNNLLEIIVQKDTKKTFAWIEEFSQTGGDFKNLIVDLLENLRLALLEKKGIKNEENKATLLKAEEISRLIKLLLEAYQMMRITPIESLPLEIAIAEFYNYRSS